MNPRQSRFRFEPLVAPAVDLAARAAAAVGEQSVKLSPHEPRLTPRDEVVFLLHATAEVEQSLMVQYLYAAFSLNPDKPLLSAQQKTAVQEWYEIIFQIAREEMGHLACMQNLLLLDGGPINFEREDFPFRRELYPFRLQLEPLTLRSLARYIAAERPAMIADPDIDRLYTEEIEPLAREENDDLPVNRVGAVFERLLWLFRDPAGVPADDPDPPVPDEDLRIEVAASLATEAEWRTAGTDIIVGPAPDQLGTSGEARTAIRELLDRIAQQGEGYPSAAPGQSHFDRFIHVWNSYREQFPQSPTGDVGPGAPARPVAVNPATVAADGAHLIVHPRSRRWAQLFNFRYRMLLGYLQHYFQYPPPDAARANLSAWAFEEMGNISVLAGKLNIRPLLTDGLPDRAGAPFEMPYTLAIPDGERNRWRAHRDVVDAATELSESLAAAEPPGDDRRYLSDLADSDRLRREELSRLMHAQPVRSGESEQ